MPFDTETQAILNMLVSQRNAALDQLAVMTGRMATLEELLAKAKAPPDASVSEIEGR